MLYLHLLVCRKYNVSLTGILDLHFGVVVVWFSNELIDEWAMVTKQCHCYENVQKHHILSRLMMRTYSMGPNQKRKNIMRARPKYGVRSCIGELYEVYILALCVHYSPQS